MGWTYKLVGETHNAYQILMGKPVCKQPFGRPRRMWKDNIKMDHRKISFQDQSWKELELCPVVGFGISSVEQFEFGYQRMGELVCFDMASESECMLTFYKPVL